MQVAIAMGRTVFDNIRKTIAYTVAHAVPELLPIFVLLILDGKSRPDRKDSQSRRLAKFTARNLHASNPPFTDPPILQSLSC